MSNGWICGPALFRFEGWFFEIHNYSGPWPLKKNGELRKHAGPKFWDMYDRFNQLDDSEKESCKAGGIDGCRRV